MQRQIARDTRDIRPTGQLQPASHVGLTPADLISLKISKDETRATSILLSFTIDGLVKSPVLSRASMTVRRYARAFSEWMSFAGLFRFECISRLPGAGGIPGATLTQHGLSPTQLRELVYSFPGQGFYREWHFSVLVEIRRSTRRTLHSQSGVSAIYLHPNLPCSVAPFPVQVVRSAAALC